MSEANSNTIVFLTGAGISAESGLKTFRDPGGIWAQVSIEDVATPQAFARDPARVHDFYNIRRRALTNGSVEPNAAHLALAKLEAEWPGEVIVITQNVDNLHERAGTKDLVHMHGELMKVRCLSCRNIAEWDEDLTASTACLACGQPGNLRPHVVWFGEMPMEMDRIYEALNRADLFVAVGTSGAVYPAAGFIDHVRQQGHTRTVELNLKPSDASHRFDATVYGPATEVVPVFVDDLLKSSAT